VCASLFNVAEGPFSPRASSELASGTGFGVVEVLSSQAWWALEKDILALFEPVPSVASGNYSPSGIVTKRLTLLAYSLPAIYTI
jgi:hypothetical protein